jgi:hypothetical protein
VSRTSRRRELIFGRSPSFSLVYTRRRGLFNSVDLKILANK